MKLFREAIIIFGIYLLGVLIADVTRLPIPGNVIGMLILFLLLCFKIIKVEQISTISNFFLDHLAFFFITTVITMACTGRIVQRIANKKEGDKNGKFN